MYFKDISNFKNTSDYLAILNGSLIADVIIILMVFFGFFKSKFLKNWYLKLNFFAVVADVLILVIGAILTRYFYPMIFKDWSIVKFTGLFVVIQVIHDVLFYIFFDKIVPRGSNVVFDMFKDYAKEVSGGAILGDSFMVVMTALLSSLLASQSLNTNIIILILTSYILPYIMYF
jgi:hypothetical protein